MDFLNKTLSQVADLFRSMTPGARITTGLLLVVVVVSVGYLFTYHQSSPDLYLLGGEHLPASQIPAMQAAFAKANLNSYELEGTRIRIPRGQQNLYMAALAENGALPENYGEILDKALDKANPWLDREARDKLFKAAREKQLAMIIRSMQGVQNAFVMYDSKTKPGFNRETLATASVNVSCKAGAQLSDAQVLAIRSLVARSIAGLPPESVAVTDLGTGRTLTGAGDAAGGSLDDPHLQRKKMYEQQWVEKAQKSLWYVPGATIIANVELEREVSHRRETVKHDPKTIPWQVMEKSQSSSSEGGGGGGRTGYVAQQPPNTALSLGATATKSKQEEEQSESRTLNLAGGERDTVEMAGLTPKRVTMSIGVPNSYFVKVWQERNPAQQGSPPKTPESGALEQIRTEEITKIRQHVANILLPVEGVADLSQLVQVTSFQDLTLPEIPPPTTSENITSWLVENWSTLGIVGLAMIALLMLRSMVKAVPEPASAVTTARVSIAAGTTASAEEEELATAAKAETSPRLRRFTGGGPSLRDELSQLVQEDPDAAANVLRAWIGTGVIK